MKKIKRFASILLALVMCIACSIPALAVDTTASEKEDDFMPVQMNWHFFI